MSRITKTLHFSALFGLISMSLVSLAFADQDPKVEIARLKKENKSLSAQVTSLQSQISGLTTERDHARNIANGPGCGVSGSGITGSKNSTDDQPVAGPNHPDGGAGQAMPPPFGLPYDPDIPVVDNGPNHPTH
jgi:hypothetical protein